MAERAKRWECQSTFLADWFANSVEYCQSSQGKSGFEEWYALSLNTLKERATNIETTGFSERMDLWRADSRSSRAINYLSRK